MIVPPEELGHQERQTPPALPTSPGCEPGPSGNVAPRHTLSEWPIILGGCMAFSERRGFSSQVPRALRLPPTFSGSSG